MSPIYNTGIVSLFIQAVTGIFDLYILLLPSVPSLFFLKSLLWIEFWVQVVEAIFYIWLIRGFREVKNITHYRYYDWIITTPSMLFTYCMYLIYIADEKASFMDAVQSNSFLLTLIFLLNTLMLFFGYIAERGMISYVTGAFFGFLPFFAMFYLIYENFAKTSTMGQYTFWYFSSVWGLYGIASMLSYSYKNTMYNILDLLSKNFFGIFLGIVLLMKK